jgi:hypothetical protein
MRLARRDMASNHGGQKMLTAVGVLIAFIRYRYVSSPLISGILILAVGPAIAQEGHHPLRDQAIHERFYSTWMMPDNRSVSCCHNQDCSPAEARLENGNWIARKVGEDDWAAIPPEKIEYDRDSPDGRSHLCGRRFTHENYGKRLTIFCFIPGAGH